MDTVSKDTRSRMMSAIRSRDTKPEMLVRKFLWREGWRFRVCDRRIEGHPDIVVPRAHALIEVRGCFWHRHGWTWDGRKLVQEAVCGDATWPKSNRAFWNDKFRKNVRRDERHEALWLEAGWHVAVLWTCGLAPAKREKTLAWLAKKLDSWSLRGAAAPRRRTARTRRSAAR